MEVKIKPRFPSAAYRDLLVDSLLAFHLRDIPEKYLPNEIADLAASIASLSVASATLTPNASSPSKHAARSSMESAEWKDDVISFPWPAERLPSRLPPSLKVRNFQENLFYDTTDGDLATALAALSVTYATLTPNASSPSEPLLRSSTESAVSKKRRRSFDPWAERLRQSLKVGKSAEIKKITRRMWTLNGRKLGVTCGARRLAGMKARELEGVKVPRSKTNNTTIQ